MNPVHYQITRKNRHHGEAIIKGFGARAVSAEGARLEPDALHLVGGLQYGSLELMQQLLGAAEPYVFFDRAYFGGGPGTNRLRVVPSAYQHHWITPRPPDRFERAGVELKPWRNEGRHILLVPPGQAVRALFGIDGWLEATALRLKSCSERPVVVSVKGDPRPLSTRLHNCWCVVTWTSNVAVEAVCAGIPVFVSRHSAAAPVGVAIEQLEIRIEAPTMPDRSAWAHSLAYGEFDLGEIESGYARSVVMDGMPG